MSDEEFPAAERRPKLKITFDDDELDAQPPAAARPSPAAPTESSAVTQPAPTAPSKTAFCTQCGTAIKPEAAFCEECGTPTSTAPSDAPTRKWLASSPPVPSAVPGPPPGDDSATAPGEPKPTGRRRFIPKPPPIVPAGPGSAAPEATPGAAPAGGLRRLRRPLWMVGGAVLVGVTLLLVLQSVFGTTRGADSPMAAVQELVNAAVNEDVAGVASILAPDETQGFGDLVSGTVGRARKAKVLGEGRDTVAGVDIAAQGLKFQDEKLSDTVHRVSIVGGAVTVTTKASEASDIGREAGLTDTSRTLDTTDLRLMTVKHDGRWFVSPEHTIAEGIVTANDAQIGDFSQDPDEIGSDAKTPEDAVKQFGSAVLSGDITSLGRTLARAERALMQSYSAALNEAYDDSGLESVVDGGSITVGEFKTSDLGGGYKKVEINSMSGTFGGEPVSFDGQCVRFSGESYCMSELNSSDGLFNSYAPDWLPKVPVITGRPYFVVRKDAKGWAVSLTATAIEYGRGFLRQHPDDTQIAQVLGEYSWVAPKATVTAGAVAKGKTDEFWGNLRVNRGAAYGVAIAIERENHVFAMNGNGDSSSYYLGGGEDGSSYPAYNVELPGDSGSAGSYVVSAAALNGALDVKTFAVPEVKQRPPDGNAIEVTIPLTPESPIVALTGTSDVPFDVEENSGALLSCTGSCTFPLVVGAKSAASAAPVKIRLSDLGATVDGSESTDGYVSGSSPSSFNVVVPSGKVATIEVTPSGSEIDVVLDVDGQREDDNVSGESETVRVSGPFDGSLDVSSYDSDESDDVTISVSTSG